MAAKKETEPVVTEAPNENELVDIQLFYDGVNYKDDLFVCVNGSSFQIKRGVKVQVPRYVAEVIHNSEVQDHRTQMLMMALSDATEKEEHLPST